MQQFIAMLAQLQEKYLVQAEELKGLTRRMETGFSDAAAGFVEVREGLETTNRRLDTVVRSLLQTSEAIKGIGKGLVAQTEMIAQLFQMQLMSAQRVEALEQQQTDTQKQVESLTQRLAQVESRLPKDAA